MNKQKKPVDLDREGPVLRNVRHKLRERIVDHRKRARLQAAEVDTAHREARIERARAEGGT